MTSLTIVCIILRNEYFFRAVGGQKNLHVIIATHSIVLAEMTLFHKIVFLKLNKEGYVDVVYLDPHEVDDIDRFLAELGGSLGISAKESFLERFIG